MRTWADLIERVRIEQLTVQQHAASEANLVSAAEEGEISHEKADSLRFDIWCDDSDQWGKLVDDLAQFVAQPLIWMLVTDPPGGLIERTLHTSEAAAYRELRDQAELAGEISVASLFDDGQLLTLLTELRGWVVYIEEAGIKS